MTLYINGRRINPIVQILVSALLIAAAIGLGILLLPLIGGILLFILICIAGLALYGVYWRWRYGDPLKTLRDRMRAQEEAQDRAAEGFQRETASSSMKPGDKAPAGIRRTTVVEDAVVVEEIKRRPPQ